MKTLLIATLAHIGLSIPAFLLIWWLAMAPQWAAATIVAAYWFGRELAQSMRPSAPFQINWTLSNTLGFVPPTALAFIAAGVISYVGS